MLRLIKQFSELFTISSNERNFYALQAFYNSLSSIHLFFCFFLLSMHLCVCANARKCIYGCSVKCLFPSLRFQTNCKTYLTFQFDDSIGAIPFHVAVVDAFYTLYTLMNVINGTNSPKREQRHLLDVGLQVPILQLEWNRRIVCIAIAKQQKCNRLL